MIRHMVSKTAHSCGVETAGVASMSHPIVTVPSMGNYLDALREAARESVETRGWRETDIVRLVKRSRWLDKRAQQLVLQALRGEPLGSHVDGGVAIRATTFLRLLPSLPPLRSAARAATTDSPSTERVLAKVRGLLAKAESTTFTDEAEACTAKAQELMARHSIDEALLDAADSSAPRGVGGLRIGVDDPYAPIKALLLGRIARENHCRMAWNEGLLLATVFGTDGDLRAVELLYTSLLVQAVAAMQRAHDSSRGFRRAFLLAFAHRIGERLREVNESATSSAIEEHGDSFLPVLAARADAAERALAETFGELKPMRLSVSNAEGYLAGRAAADAASLDRGPQLAS